MQTESESEFHWNAQSILGTATIFTYLGTAARAASVAFDGPALGRTECGKQKEENDQLAPHPSCRSACSKSPSAPPRHPAAPALALALAPALALAVAPAAAPALALALAAPQPHTPALS